MPAGGTGIITVTPISAAMIITAAFMIPRFVVVITMVLIVFLILVILLVVITDVYKCRRTEFIDWVR